MIRRMIRGGCNVERGERGDVLVAKLEVSYRPRMPTTQKRLDLAARHYCRKKNARLFI